jgi:methylase of polypeptide subunit release factors
VRSGPFQGMNYRTKQAEGCLVARLLGCYESELHGELEKLISEAPDVIIDIGCAEGYYALGLARRLPRARVYARDTNPRAQILCRQLANR